MKKILKINLCLSLILLISIALSLDSFSSTFNNDLKNEFQYKIEDNPKNSDKPTQEDSKYKLIKRTTLYLLGMQTEKETNEAYLTRKERFLGLIISRADSNSEDNQKIYENVKRNFEEINESTYEFGDINSIQIREDDTSFYANVIINNAKVIEKNNYLTEKEAKYNLSIHYEYRKKGDSYELTFVSMNRESDNDLEKILNFQNCKDISNETINSIFDNNKTKLVTIKSGNTLGNGFFIKKDLIITTWSFFQSIIDSNDISIKDYNDKAYNLEGIATVSTSNNLIVIKTKESSDGVVSLGDDISVENGVINVSSLTRKGETSQKGLIITNNYYLGATIPLTLNDEGSALFDKSGKVVGIATSISTDVDVSYYIKANEINKAKELFNNIENVPTKSIEEIANKYSLAIEKDTTKAKKKTKWGEYKKIGKLENTFKQDLNKVTYKDKVFTARYHYNESIELKELEDVQKYIQQLEKQKYKKLDETTNQIIYYNNTYLVTIQKIPHYIIIRISKI